MPAAEAERFHGKRRALYNTLRLDGILQTPVGLVVSHLPPEGPVLGTTSMPAASTVGWGQRAPLSTNWI